MEILFLPVFLFVLATPVVAIWALVRSFSLDRRLRELERERRTFAAAPRPPEPSAAVEPPRAAVPAPPAPLEPRPLPVPPPAAARRAEPPPIVLTPPAGPPADLEFRIGVRWFNIAGIVTLLFGVAFFLKWAYDNAWIGPRGRVAIGIASGLAAIVFGESIRRRGHRIVSEGLTGGGIAALYLSFFFSFRLYQLIEVPPAFALMAAVTAGGVALALLQNSLAIALLAFTGAYLTPILLSTGQDAAEFLFAYLTVLGLGALCTTYFKRWRALDILSFAGTCVLYSGWHDRYYRPERLGVAVAGLAAFYLIFLLIPYGHNLARRVPARAGDHVLSLANAVYTFGYLYRMINPLSPKALGFIAIILAAGYLGLGALARRRMPEDRGLAVSILGLAIAFLAMAVPLELGLHGITLAWAAQGLAVLWLGFRYEARLTRLAGFALIGLAVARLFFKHLPLHELPFTLVWNPTFGTWLAVAAALVAAAMLGRTQRARLTAGEWWIPSGALVAASLLVVISLHAEVSEYFGLWSLSADHRAAVIMIVWAVAPLLIRAAGRRLDDRPLRHTGLLLHIVALVPFIGLTHRVGSASDPLFGSLVFWMGVLGVGSYAAASEWSRRLEPELKIGEIAPHKFLAAMATALLWVLLTVEVYSHFLLAMGAQEEAQGNELRALLGVSVLWTLFASTLMAIGFAKSHKTSRYCAAALFALTLAKVFLLDTTELRAIYRVLSFLCLGLLLVVASLAYSKFRSRIAVAVACACLSLAAAGDLRAEFSPEEWRYLREIDTTDGGSGAGEFRWIVLDETILAGARPDLADLRIVGRDGLEIPYVVRSQPGGVRQEAYEPRLASKAVGKGGAAVVEIDFGAKVVKNRLLVQTEGADFRRRVMVEGSDGEGFWVTLRDDAWIYRVPAALAAGKSYEEVQLADEDHRRLRVTVFPMPDDKGRVVVSRIQAFKRTELAADTEPLRVESFHQEDDPNSRSSRIEIDLGHRSARPFDVDLDFSDPAFRRAYSLSARNELTTRTVRGRTEGREEIVDEVETPWQTTSEGIVFRLPPGRAGEGPIDETRLRVSGIPARYLRVVIQNADDQPLRLIGVRATALVQRVVFPVRPGGAYTIYYGSPAAAAPKYDLPALLPDLERRLPTLARLGLEQENPLWRSGPPAPFFERHGWLLWVVLLAAVGVLSLIVFRNARGIAQARK